MSMSSWSLRSVSGGWRKTEHARITAALMLRNLIEEEVVEDAWSLRSS
jgi:hypothetical protein